MPQDILDLSLKTIFRDIKLQMLMLKNLFIPIFKFELKSFCIFDI